MDSKGLSASPGREGEKKEETMGSKLNDLFAILFAKDSKSQVKHLEEDKGFSPARAELAAQIGLARLPLA